MESQPISPSQGCKSFPIKTNTIGKDGFHLVQTPTINGTFHHTNIPKVVHYIYKSTIMPLKYANYIHKCMKLNPDVTFVLWTDAEGLQLLYDYFPKTIYSYYKALPRMLMKTDMLRIAILYLIGGIYLDADMDCNKPFQQLFDEQFIEKNKAIHCIVDKEVEIQTQVLHGIPYAVMNNLIICEKSHPFLRYTLINFPALEDSKYVTDEKLLYVTGPMFLTAVLKKYQKSEISRKQTVTIAHSHWFSPWVEKDLVSWCLEANLRSTNIWKLWGCARVAWYEGERENNLRNAYLIHRFLHYGYKHYDHKMYEDICKTSAMKYVLFQ